MPTAFTAFNEVSLEVRNILNCIAEKLETPGFITAKELEAYKADPTLAIIRGVLEGYKICFAYIDSKTKENTLCQHHEQFVTEPKK